MKSFKAQKNSFLLLLVILVVVSLSIVYLFIGARDAMQQATVTPTATTPFTPLAELSETRPAKPCSLKQRDFQMGIAFPQWTPEGYGQNDAKWVTELPDMRKQTATCWVEMPVLLYQASQNSTSVTTGPSTPTLSSFAYGITYAHFLGLHIFVTPLLQVNGAQPWAGAIKFSSYQQEQQWFTGYWRAIKPYLVIAAQTHVEQFALGTEFEWLQENAPGSLWEGLIAEFHSVFPGTLTYDTNWDVIKDQPPSWMQHGNLKMIGVSAYLPILSAPRRVDPKDMFGLWQQTIKRALDNFAIALGKPIFLSEIGYRNSADAFYHSWESTSSAPPDPEEQAAACDAALANIIPDQYILGSFFWGWDDTGAFNLKGLQAATVIHSHYKALQA